MTLRHFALSLLLGVVVILGVYKLYDLYHRPLTHHLNADMQWIGVIEMDNAPLTLESILNGENTLLVVDHVNLLYGQIIQKIPQARYFTTEELFNLANLHLFARQKNGTITAKQPIFSHLFILKFYDNGREYEIKSLAAAGIQEISVNNASMNGRYTLLMKDGTQNSLISTNKIEKNKRPD